MTTQEQVKDVVSQVLADKADKGGIKRVVWIGAGGSNGGNYPAQYFMEHEATQVVSSSYTSNEFVHATPAYVNENTLAVVVSMRGTKETIVAAQVAKDHGASTIAIYVDESALTEVCDYKIQYDSLAVDESCMGRTNSAVVTMIAMELTQQTEGYAEYETAMAAFDLVDPIYRKAVEYTRPLAAKWAEQNADKPCINVMAQGPLFGAAYVFSICNVQEMLQIDSCTINTCDFFHGPFEILDKRTSLFQLISVGRSRCNDERGIRFVNQYGGERVYQLDAKELGLTPHGTMAHEFLQACQALGPRLRDTQVFAFEMWAKEYRGDLGIALSDVYGMDPFLRDFDMFFCKLFDGVRHDSGDPFVWGERMIEHWKANRCDPRTKSLIFSDSLTVPKAIELYERFHGRVKVAFGIGTNLMNDRGPQPLNVVMKMVKANGQPVAKISDAPEKGMCEDEGYLRYLRQVFGLPPVA